jgi:hypothetical protein
VIFPGLKALQIIFSLFVLIKISGFIFCLLQCLKLQVYNFELCLLLSSKLKFDPNSN